jgi:hypothetical protein
VLHLLLLIKENIMRKADCMRRVHTLSLGQKKGVYPETRAFSPALPKQPLVDWNWKITLFLLLLLAAAASPLFAQNDLLPSGLNDLAGKVQEIFTGKIVRVILICCLAGCAVAYGFNKDNEKMKRNIIAIAVAIAILVAAQSIVEAVWNAAGKG